MEFYGLVRVGPKNLFSRRAAKKATQEAATSEPKKNMKKNKKSSGEKCTNHTPLLRGEGAGRAASWSSPAAQDTRSHAVAGRSEVGEQRTENSTAGAEEGRQFFTDLESAYRATSFEYLLSSRIPSPPTHTHWKRYSGSFFCFSFFAVLRPWHFPSLLLLVLRRARRFVYAFVNVVTEIFTSAALGVITIMKSYYEP